MMLFFILFSKTFATQPGCDGENCTRISISAGTRIYNALNLECSLWAEIVLTKFFDLMTAKWLKCIWSFLKMPKYSQKIRGFS